MLKGIIGVLFAIYAVTVSAQDIIGRDLEQRINATRTMSANFTQTVSRSHRAVVTSSGTMDLSRPYKFRWQTNAPTKQILVADGKRFWIYDVDLEQVTVRSQQRGIGGAAGIFLNGYNRNTAKRFNVSAALKGNHTLFTLKAKSNAGFQTIVLDFVNVTLTQLQLLDNLGQNTIIKFSNIKKNSPIAPSKFQLIIPRGVDVVQQ